MTRYKILYTLKHFIRYFIHMDFFFIDDISGSQLWGLSFAKVLTDLFKKLYPPLVSLLVLSDSTLSISCILRRG